eukprot:GHVS01027117.1.p1 GENE.GHVS01027117.1~~GHVS01027117.1.p1  ORF type:complete len:1043 (+),score=252.07 GHVS01027117.1:28-3156(+)
MTSRELLMSDNPNETFSPASPTNSSSSSHGVTPPVLSSLPALLFSSMRPSSDSSTASSPRVRVPLRLVLPELRLAATLPAAELAKVRGHRQLTTLLQTTVASLKKESDFLVLGYLRPGAEPVYLTGSDQLVVRFLKQYEKKKYSKDKLEVPSVEVRLAPQRTNQLNTERALLQFQRQEFAKYMLDQNRLLSSSLLSAVKQTNTLQQENQNVLAQLVDTQDLLGLKNKELQDLKKTFKSSYPEFHKLLHMQEEEGTTTREATEEEQEETGLAETQKPGGGDSEQRWRGQVGELEKANKQLAERLVEHAGSCAFCCGSQFQTLLLELLENAVFGGVKDKLELYMKTMMGRTSMGQVVQQVDRQLHAVAKTGDMVVDDMASTTTHNEGDTTTTVSADPPMADNSRGYVGDSSWHNVCVMVLSVCSDFKRYLLTARSQLPQLRALEQHEFAINVAGLTVQLERYIYVGVGPTLMERIQQTYDVYRTKSTIAEVDRMLSLRLDLLFDVAGEYQWILSLPEAMRRTSATIWRHAATGFHWIDDSWTPHDKLACLSMCLATLSNYASHYIGKDNVTGSVLSDWLLTLIIRTKPTNLYSQVQYCDKLLPPEKKFGHEGYVIATYLTVLQWMLDLHPATPPPKPLWSSLSRRSLSDNRLAASSRTTLGGGGEPKPLMTPTVFEVGTPLLSSVVAGGSGGAPTSSSSPMSLPIPSPRGQLGPSVHTPSSSSSLPPPPPVFSSSSPTATTTTASNIESFATPISTSQPPRSPRQHYTPDASTASSRSGGGQDGGATTAVCVGESAAARQPMVAAAQTIASRISVTQPHAFATALYSLLVQQQASPHDPPHPLQSATPPPSVASSTGSFPTIPFATTKQSEEAPAVVTTTVDATPTSAGGGTSRRCSEATTTTIVQDRLLLEDPLLLEDRLFLEDPLLLEDRLLLADRLSSEGDDGMESIRSGAHEGEDEVHMILEPVASYRRVTKKTPLLLRRHSMTTATTQEEVWHSLMSAPSVRARRMSSGGVLRKGEGAEEGPSRATEQEELARCCYLGF